MTGNKFAADAGLLVATVGYGRCGETVAAYPDALGLKCRGGSVSHINVPCLKYPRPDRSSSDYLRVLTSSRSLNDRLTSGQNGDNYPTGIGEALHIRYEPGALR